MGLRKILTYKAPALHKYAVRWSSSTGGCTNC